MTYVPPKTKAWSDNGQARMITYTKHSFNKAMEGGDNMLIWGDCKDVCWEEMSSEGGGDSSGNV